MANLFLYNKPFVVKDDVNNRQDHLIDYLTEEDKMEERKIHAILLKFAIANQVVNQEGESVENSNIENIASWVWIINWDSARSLVDMVEYDKLLGSLLSSNGLPMNRVIDLHTRLGSLFDVRLLNTLANRVIQTIGLIPYKVPDNNEAITWEKIHSEHPFIWILILTQAIFRTEIIKIT